MLQTIKDFLDDLLYELVLFIFDRWTRSKKRTAAEMEFIQLLSQPGATEQETQWKLQTLETFMYSVTRQFFFGHLFDKEIKDVTSRPSK